MSLKSYSSYKSDYEKISSISSADPAVRENARKERVARVSDLRAKSKDASPGAPPAEVRALDALYDRAAVRPTIGCPKPQTRRVHVLLVDNSGSNRRIAEHLRKTSGYLLATLGSIDPESQLAVVYFSDHGDGPLYEQSVDWVSPDPEGDRILHSTTAHVRPASGGDAPEAIECILHDACDLDFGTVEERHLYLVTDVVGHGMGMSGDQGCPLQRSWTDSLERVRKTFTSFVVVGCGSDPKVGELQQKLVAKDRVHLDLVDLSGIESAAHRMGITGNAFLFLAARGRGLQTVEMFLMGLYEKWLGEPIFGANTDLGARQAIERFGKYLDEAPERVSAMMESIFA